MSDRFQGKGAGQGWQAGVELAGISEWTLPNGLRVLILPDPSQPTLTVNMVYLVGSRMETRGDRGVAHLLEHMLFKGTPTFPEIPRALREKGARFNGTTWLDRTHYFETLPASNDNLRFALQLEAERMNQVAIEEDELNRELGVVKNELLRGENVPGRVLFQRVMATAYQRHGYGHPTIGLMDDLNEMTVERVRHYYETHYVPNRAVLVVAGDVQVEQVLDEIEKRFGGMEPCRIPVEETSRFGEPPQDGPRQIELRRVTEVSELVAGYHVPAGGHVDFAALQLLVHICSLRPTGRLYRQLVEQSVGSAVSSVALALHDPGVFLVSVDVPDTEAIENAETTMLRIIETELAEGVSTEELARASNEIQKRATLEMADSSRLAVALTEAIALGDWRYYFLQKEQHRKVTCEDIQRVASTYLVESNRTLGRLIASKRDQKIEVPGHTAGDLLTNANHVVHGPTPGEPFATSLHEVEERIGRDKLASRFRIAKLDRQTRGDLVTFVARFRFGNERALVGQSAATRLLADWMMRGSKQRDHLGVQDSLRRMNAWLSGEGFRGGMTFEGQVPRESLAGMFELLHELLLAPRFEQDEFNVLRASALSNLDQMRTQPPAVAQNSLRRYLADHPSDSVLHVPTMDDRRLQLSELKAENCRDLYQQVMGGEFGELVLIGPRLDETDVANSMEWIGNWQAAEPAERIVENAQDHQGTTIDIDMPDKTNIGLAVGMNLPLQDDHSDYASLLVSNFAFGGATLVSRLSREIRGKRGISYSISSSLSGHPVDERGRFAIQATANPEKRSELVETIKEEVQRWVDEGLSQEELDNCKTSLLESRRTARASIPGLAHLIISNLFVDRSLDFVEQQEASIKSLTVEDVNQATKRWIDPNKLAFVIAGDQSRQV